MTHASLAVMPPDFSSPVSSAASESRLLREASRAYADKRWAECAQLVQQVLATRPRSVAADDWLNLGSALDQPQRPDLAGRADQVYRKALALGPTQKDAVLRQLAALRKLCLPISLSFSLCWPPWVIRGF